MISPARADTPLLGVDVVLAAGTTELPLEVHFEHALLVVQGAIDVEGRPIDTGDLAYVGPGHQMLAVRSDHSARVLLLGGAPFAERILMWWNFVAHSRAEVEQATHEWNTQNPRFGSVSSSLARIPAPPLPGGLRH